MVNQLVSKTISLIRNNFGNYNKLVVTKHRRKYQLQRKTHWRKCVRYSKHSCHKNADYFANVWRYHVSDELPCVVIYSPPLSNSLLRVEKLLSHNRIYDRNLPTLQAYIKFTATIEAKLSSAKTISEALWKFIA